MRRFSREHVNQLARDLLSAMSRIESVVLLKDRDAVLQAIAGSLADELRREEEREENVRRRMALTWGIESFLVDRVTHTDAMYRQVDTCLIESGLAEVGDKVVVISGSPPGIPGSTNDLRVHVVGDAVNAAAPAWESGEHAD